MKITMNDSRIQTIEQIEALLKSNQLDFKIETKQESYEWVQAKLIQFKYLALKKNGKGIIREYLAKLTGYSASQITRLITQYRQTGYVRLKGYRRQNPNQCYDNEDIRLLAETDELHNYPCGPTLKTILQREVNNFDKSEYINIARISVSHIYNLRKTSTYKRITKSYQPTKPSIVQIGERRKPNPQGRPGYLRVDTVHQGDRDGVKGLYHINIVDEVTQIELIGAVEKISEAYLLPLLTGLLEQYPFHIIEFHPDNGSEYINRKVAALLNKMNIKLTKGRPRQCNDNALVEGKNGWVVRKFMGYAYIEQKHAETVNKFYNDYFNDYLNYHRPCAFASEVETSKGKIKKVYKLKDYQTPYEKLKSLKQAEQYLRPGITFTQLDKIAYQYSDNEYAKHMMEARDKLFREIMLPNLFVKTLST